ncbi:hydroxyacid dehydrogenase [Candidatus Woesearchaeota archaeon]|nr:hydroxyacid dehydrogenase [Candidatus Woesearchaeota archaeon]
MKIAFFGLEHWEKEFVQKEFPKDQLFLDFNKLTAGNVSKFNSTEVISIFIDNQLDKNILNKMPKLKLIATRSTGFDHIDSDACRKKNITICNVPFYGENTVAEHTFALILGLSRKIVPSVERTRKGSFELEGLRGFDLKGKTIGLIGCGNIGQHVAKIAQGLEMKILVFDLVQDKKLAKKYNFRYISLNEVLKHSDIVTLHVPYNKHTHHLIDEKKIALFKTGAYLINTSRGAVVDTNALVKALKDKKLAGAGLDVLEEENHMCEELSLLSKEKVESCNLKTILQNHLLLEMPNVLITPHNAFNTQEALHRILKTTLQNIKSFRKGRKLNKVN